MGGNEVFIKSIAQAILVYAMMVFKIPKNICKGISDAISQFWWGDDNEHKKIHWKAWWKLCIPKRRGGMGFRDLHSFNIAMLAKHVRRLLSDLYSLSARVMRARYYPDGKLLNAKLKSGSSYTWQSVLAGLECFKRGCIWRVGDGSQINIWEDNWIPSSHNLKIQTPRGTNIVRTVNELINPVDGSWDEDLINSLLWPTDVHCILQIPISPGREDVVAWHHNRNGLFTVRSAYHSQWEYKFERGRTGEASGVGDNPVWDKLWKLDLPGKIKIFGWRVLHGMIPCKGVLANKHIGNQGSCPLCPSGCEDIKHMLFTCDRAREVWRCLGVWDRIEEVLNIDRSGSILMEEIIRIGGKIPALNNVGLVELVLTAGWYIWWERRKFVHGESIQTPFISAMSIAVLTTNYMMSLRKTSNIRQGWKKPPEGKLMVNVDAAFDTNTGSGSTGVIIRDEKGQWVAAAHSFLPHVVDAPMA